MFYPPFAQVLKGHTVLTDKGAQFTPQPPQFLPGRHSFDHICREYGVAHRLTKPAHPWTNGQVEPMNRTQPKNKGSANG